jgi:hypothetical protein
MLALGVLSNGKFGVYPYDLFGFGSGLLISAQFDVSDCQVYVSEDTIRVFLERLFIRSDSLLIPAYITVRAS